ncbi:hypothetical protein, partial [Escherichia coli]|uniref:hypothetical protein n=1 Tax=Escherichia coli TaxID=562 RepID=UPI001BAF4C91
FFFFIFFVFFIFESVVLICACMVGFERFGFSYYFRNVRGKSGMSSFGFPFLRPVFTPNWFDSAYKSARPEDILRRAINNGEFVPFYQPVVNGREGTLRGVEV